MSYFLACLAAVSNALSNVLQRKVTRDVPDDRAMRLGLLIDLVRRPLWLAALGTIIVSFLLLAAALSMGRLAAVDPIITLELPLTLVLASKVLGGRLARRDWWSIAALTIGLGGFIGFLSPQAGSGGRAPAMTWLLASGLTIAVLGLIVVSSLGRVAAVRAVLLGVAAGMTFGLTAAFMKGMTAQFGQGPVGVLSAWQTYAMAASGIGGLFLAQNALQAGRLIYAQPGLTLSDPLVSIVWGIAVFNETTSGGLRLLLAVASGAIMVIGAVLLTRSPLLRQVSESSTHSQSADQIEPSASASPT